MSPSNHDCRGSSASGITVENYLVVACSTGIFCPSSVCFSTGCALFSPWSDLRKHAMCMNLSFL